MMIKEYITKLSKKINDESYYVELNSENISDIYVRKSSINKPHDKDESVYDDEELDDDRDENDAVAVSDIINGTSRIVLLGNPGSGKTTIINNMMRKYLNRCADGDYSLVPFLILLKDIHNLSDWESVVSGLTDSNEFYQLMTTGNVILMLDGLNELSANCHKDVITRIQRLMDEFGQMPIVMTSRKSNYKHELDLEEYQILDFDEGAIKDYIIKRTGKPALYEELSQQSIFSSDMISPLVLKMAIDLWQENGNIPELKTQLYERFIHYQLKKSIPEAVQAHKLLITLLSNVAFYMRSDGYISDNEDNIKSVLEKFVGSDNLDFVSRLALQSGLLNIDIVSNDFHFVSFIHETFQEYLAALHIAIVYKDTGKFCVPTYHYLWQEPLKSTLEILTHDADGERIVNLMDCLNKSYLEGSDDRYINQYLPMMVDACNDVAEHNDICASWLEQYVFMQMNNYLNLPIEQHSDENFDLIVSAVLMLKNSKLQKLLFLDPKWLHEWLICEDEDVDSEQPLPMNERTNSIIASIGKASNVLDIYLSVMKLMENLDFIDSTKVRVAAIEDATDHHLSSKDYKVLFEKTGQEKFLYSTFDKNYIRKVILDKADNLTFKYSKALLCDYDIDCMMLYFEDIYPILEKRGEGGKNSKKVKRSFKYKEVQKLIFTNSIYKKLIPQILEECYYLPEESLSKEYFDYIRARRQDSIKSVTIKKRIVSWEHLALENGRHLYILEGKIKKTSPANDTSQYEPFLSELLKKRQDAKLVYIQNIKCRIKSRGPIDTEEYRLFSDVFPSNEVLHTITKYPTIRIIIKLDIPYAPLDYYFSTNEKIRYIDQLISIDYIHPEKSAKFALMADSEIEVTDEHYIFEEQPSKPILNPENVFYYRNDELREMKNEIAHLDNETLLKTGLLEFFPEKFRNEEILDRCYVVKCVFGDVVILGRGDKTFKFSGKNFRLYKTDDIVYKVNNKYIVIESPELYWDKIFHIGHFISCRNGWTIIEDDVDSQRYKTHKVFELQYGEKVIFFPIVNKFESHTLYNAYRVSLLADVLKRYKFTYNHLVLKV